MPIQFPVGICFPLITINSLIVFFVLHEKSRFDFQVILAYIKLYVAGDGCVHLFDK